jgi:hypothetical protein
MQRDAERRGPGELILYDRVVSANNVAQNLLDLAAECEEAGTSFIAYLESLTSHSSSNLLRSAKTAIKFHWSSHKIDDFVAKLAKLRDSLTLATVLALRTSSETSNGEILTHLKEIQQDHRARNLDGKEIQTAVQILIDAVQDQASDRIDAIRNEIESCLKEINDLRNKVSPEERSGSRESEILRWLDFRQSLWRYESVATAYRKTCGWIYDSPTTHNSWSDFSLHLRQDDNRPYFISGKAGSGKSTLMKFIYDNPRTREALKLWAGTSELMNVHFFFWNLGTTLQKTHVGMLRALLHTVLDKHPELVPAVFPRLDRNWKTSDADVEPEYVEVKEAFGRLIEKSRFLRLAMFIDGIDEFEGDHRDMALFLRSLASPHVKLIVSSRPINACLDALAGCPTLLLQELTRPDMEKFVQAELSSNHLMARLMQQFPARAPKLITDLLDKAEGVFLWVKLVVRLLVDGLENGDTLEELYAKLTLLPSDLRDLYRNMFGKMRIEYQKQAAVIFQLLHQWRHSIPHRDLPGLVLSYAICPPADVFEAPIAPMTGDTFDWIMGTLDKRIRSRCCGLLELRYNEDTLAGWLGAVNADEPITIVDANRTVVTYLHRTVAEFISAAEVWPEVCELTNDMAFDCNSSLASACLSTMKLVNRFEEPQLKWYLEAAADFCRKATTTEPHVIQKYVLEMDNIMSVIYGKSLSIYDEGSCQHWSVTSHHLDLNGIDPAVDDYASIHTFAAGEGLLAHLRLLSLDADHEGRFVIVLHALSMWGDKLPGMEITLEEGSDTLSYLLRNVSSPESAAFNTSLWQQALSMCRNMQAYPGRIHNLAAARLLKIFLSTVGSPQSLWQTSSQAWQSTSADPTDVLNSFRAHTHLNPSQENKALLHDLERLTGTKDKCFGDAGVNHKGPKSQNNRRNGRKPRRNKKIKQRAIGEAGWISKCLG